MAKTETSARKPSGIARVGNWFKTLIPRIIRAFKDMAAELKKVTWPTRKELISYSVAVLAFLVVMGVIIFVIDAASAALINWII
ncbi:MAG: preprotein translocase subunit SecE [Clostridia bacterium]|nr:preprotein translocase subunit SecE [Clostridia bacterium]